MLDVPVGDLAHRQRAGGHGDGVLFLAAGLALRVGQRGLGARLHAQADAGGDRGVIRDLVGDGRAGDAGRGAGAFSEQRAAARQRGQRGQTQQGKRAAARDVWRDDEQAASPLREIWRRKV
ncbi:hypothetical protein D3C72_1994990 [compost metagenome]